MKMYIIGNGFDRHHKLETKYCDFHKYLKTNHPELACILNEYFQFEMNDDYLWKNFERDLATFKYEAFFENHNHLDVLSDSFKLSEGFGLEDDINQETEDLIASIRRGFYDWISSIDCSRIKTDDRIDFFDLDINALFLNFNYTPTLEEVYGVKRVTYIHNNAAEYYEDLIMGHGEANLRKPLPEELDENGDSNRTLFTDAYGASTIPFTALQKNTESAIENHRDFFENLHDVQEIIIIGHSLGDVDLPYFREIVKSCKSASWEIHCYKEEDRRRAVEVVGMLEIHEGKVSYVT